MKVSIIIPTYNEEEYLSACLESILNLDYPKEDIEIIVVDNGSTDRTMELVKYYEIKVLHDDSKNVSGLRNLGAGESKGDFLAFVDADCIVSKDWLKNAIRYADDMDVAAWGSPPDIPKDATWVQRTWYLVRKKRTQVETLPWLESMNIFVRKDQFLAIGGFNESLITCEDVDFSYRIRNHGKIISDSRIKVIHVGEASTIKEFFNKEIWRGQSNLKGILSHGLLLKELPSLSIPLYFGIIFPILFLISLICFHSKGLIGALVIYLVPTLLVLFKLRKKRMKAVDVIRLFLLLQIYFFSRTIAVIKRA